MVLVWFVFPKECLWFIGCRRCWKWQRCERLGQKSGGGFFISGFSGVQGPPVSRLRGSIGRQRHRFHASSHRRFIFHSLVLYKLSSSLNLDRTAGWRSHRKDGLQVLESDPVARDAHVAASTRPGTHGVHTGQGERPATFTRRGTRICCPGTDKPPCSYDVSRAQWE